jgi:hypothetical protein
VLAVVAMGVLYELIKVIRARLEQKWEYEWQRASEQVRTQQISNLFIPYNYNILLSMLFIADVYYINYYIKSLLC